MLTSLLGPWVSLASPALPRRGEASSSKKVSLTFVLSCRKSHPTLSVPRSWRSRDVPPRTDTKPSSPVRATASLCPTFAQVPRAGSVVWVGVWVGGCAGERDGSEHPWHRGGHSWVLLVVLSCWFLLRQLQELGAVLQGGTPCCGVVRGELLLGVHSQGVRRMAAQPGLLPVTMSQGHVTGGIKAENIPGGLVWAPVRHCGEVLGGHHLASELLCMLPVVQVGLGMAGCILPRQQG